MFFGNNQTFGLSERLKPVKTVVTIGAAIDVALIAGVYGRVELAGAGVKSLGLDTLASRFSQATLRAFQRQLAQHGRAALEKSLSSFEKRLAEHLLKIEAARKAGGYTSSMEREVKIFRESIAAIKHILGNGP